MKHRNPNLFITTQCNDEFSWGFSQRLQNPNETINEFYKVPFWVHFIGTNPKLLQMVIHTQYDNYLKMTNFPRHRVNNFYTWKDTGEYLLIWDYLNENNLDKIIDLICNINLE